MIFLAINGFISILLIILLKFKCTTPISYDLFILGFTMVPILLVNIDLIDFFLFKLFKLFTKYILLSLAKYQYLFKFFVT